MKQATFRIAIGCVDDVSTDELDWLTGHLQQITRREFAFVSVERLTDRLEGLQDAPVSPRDDDRGVEQG